jgi:hypothetical protein
MNVNELDLRSGPCCERRNPIRTKLNAHGLNPVKFQLRFNAGQGRLLSGQWSLPFSVWADKQPDNRG